MKAVLKSVRLWELVEKQGGLDADITPKALSHGEQQILVLGRAILRKRASNGKRHILILDETTSNLDASSEMAIHEAVREEFENDTVISVAHRVDALQNMDTVILLEKGKIVKTGKPADVIHSTLD